MREYMHICILHICISSHMHLLAPGAREYCPREVAVSRSQMSCPPGLVEQHRTRHLGGSTDRLQASLPNKREAAFHIHTQLHTRAHRMPYHVNASHVVILTAILLTASVTHYHLLHVKTKPLRISYLSKTARREQTYFSIGHILGTCTHTRTHTPTHTHTHTHDVTDRSMT